MSNRRPRVVMKFGGTSVGSPEAIGRLASIVARAVHVGLAPVVVVSAFSKVTDALLAAASEAQRGDDGAAAERLSQLSTRHHDTIASLLGKDEALASAIEGHLEQTRAVLTAISILRDASARSTDAVAAAGELMSSRIVAAALRSEGVSAEFVDARRVLITDENHSAAAPLMSATEAAVRDRLVPLLDRLTVPVLGGYIGATGDGVTTTLGRGGSDYSAALFAAAIEARELQIWTDVDGMLTADPRIVNSPRAIAQLSFDEASELAYFGAKVLHPSTILPAMRADIPVRILNSRRPESRGTLITRDPAPEDAPVTAFACKRGVTVLDITSTRMLMAYGFLRRVFEVFERHRTAVDVVTTSEVSVSVTVDDDTAVAAIASGLREFADVSVAPRMGIVCAVGEPLRRDPRLAAGIIAALDGFPIAMVSQAASRRNLTVVIPDEQIPAAMNRLHAQFFAQAVA